MPSENAPQGVLLDIEGTTSSISFVVDVMFPFALERLNAFLDERMDTPQVQQAAEQIAHDAGQPSLAAWCATTGKEPKDLVAAEVRRLMAADVKATGLKALQGLIWEGGFRSGHMQAHVYPDVIPAIARWRDAGIDVRIYSSGSVAAQRLFFGHLAAYGNCLHLFSGHYDTTTGPKTQSASFTTIAADWGIAPSQILFISDSAAELDAAHAAGMKVLASVRPGNAPLPKDFQHPQISRFDELLAS
jgi:enolase-phosphatase E1